MILNAALLSTLTVLLTLTPCLAYQANGSENIQEAPIVPLNERQRIPSSESVAIWREWQAWHASTMPPVIHTSQVGPAVRRFEADSSSEEDADPGSPFSHRIPYGGPVPSFDILVHGPDGGWFDGASDHDRDIVIRAMQMKWHFPYSTLGLYQSALHARRTVTFDQASLILDEERDPSRENRRLIRAMARETYPKSEEWEVDKAFRVKEDLMELLPLPESHLDNLIIFAFRLEGMEDMPEEAVVQHILYKVNHRQDFEREQLARYRAHP